MKGLNNSAFFFNIFYITLDIIYIILYLIEKKDVLLIKFIEDFKTPAKIIGKDKVVTLAIISKSRVHVITSISLFCKHATRIMKLIHTSHIFYLYILN